MALTAEDVREALVGVVDPEIQVSIVDLGLVRTVDLAAQPDGRNDVRVTMTLTAPGCPYGPEIVAAVRAAALALPAVGDVRVKLTFRPPWDPRRDATTAGKDALGIWEW